MEKKRLLTINGYNLDTNPAFEQGCFPAVNALNKLRPHYAFWVYLMPFVE